MILKVAFVFQGAKIVTFFFVRSHLTKSFRSFFMLEQIKSIQNLLSGGGFL